MADTLEKAHQIALDEGFHVLADTWKRDTFEAYACASTCVEMRLGGAAMAIVIAVVPDSTS